MRPAANLLFLASAVGALIVSSASAAADSPEEAGTLTIERALELARANLPALRQARAQADQAMGLRDEARATWYPTVTLSLGYKRTTGNIASTPGLTLVGEGLPAPTATTYDYFTNSVAASQLLWDFGQTPNKSATADESARAQAENEQTMLLQAELAVRTAFFTAAAQRALVAVAETNFQNTETHLAEARAFVKEGTQPEIALATAEASRANALVQLITTRNAYATAKTKLNQSMGIGLGGSIAFEVQTDPIAPVAGEDAPLETLVADALARRPEVASLEAQRRSAEANVRANRDVWFPTLSAVAGATLNGTSLGATSWFGLTPNFNAGLVLGWSLNVGPLVPAQVRVARAQLAAAQAQIDTLRLQVRTDVETAQLAVQAAREAVLAAAQGREAANTQLALANGRFATGVGNAVEISDAQLAADQAGAQAVQAQLNLDVARSQLVSALGQP
jgi:outer membrane protein